MIYDNEELTNELARIRDKYNLYERNPAVVSCPVECLLELEQFIDETINKINRMDITNRENNVNVIDCPICKGVISSASDYCRTCCNLGFVNVVMINNEYRLLVLSEVGSSGER